MRRRALLKAGVAGLTLAVGPFSLRASDAYTGLLDSDLIYLSPYRSDGSLSRCQAEVWYTMLGTDVFVCTASDSWRALAPLQGLIRTKLWIGDLGIWKNADYESLPAVIVEARIESDQKVIEFALKQFGYKYFSEWKKWGPRFSRGLINGSRTMLRYSLLV